MLLSKHIQTLNPYTKSTTPTVRSYLQAFKDSRWSIFIKDGFNTLIANKTWVLIPLLRDVKIINCIWLFKRKQMHMVLWLGTKLD